MWSTGRGSTVITAWQKTGSICLQTGGTSPLKNGDEILVQISRAAVKTKDAVLTSKLSLTGQYGVLTLDGSGLGISSKIRDAGWKEQMKE